MTEIRPSGGWTLCEGVEFIRRHQEKAHSLLYNLSLGGGVLNKCLSFHDLDIVCAPACWRHEQDTATAQNYFKFLSWLLVTFPKVRAESCHDWNGQMFKHSCIIDDGRWIDWLIVKGK